jgi:hypothetical protein
MENEFQAGETAVALTLVWGWVCQALSQWSVPFNFNEPRGARLGTRRCRATTLYSVGSERDPYHEAVIRFGGKAPGRGNPF